MCGRIFWKYISVKRNNWNHRQGSQTLPTRLTCLTTARKPKSPYKTNSLARTIKHSCEGRWELFEISARDCGESVQGKQRALKMSRKEKNVEKKERGRKGFGKQGAVFNLNSCWGQWERRCFIEAQKQKQFPYTICFRARTCFSFDPLNRLYKGSTNKTVKYYKYHHGNWVWI